MKRLYLDYNATAPLEPAVRAALLSALDLRGNAASVHAEGRAAKACVARGRAAVAAALAAVKENVIFTSGATEAAATLLTPHYVFGRKPLFMSHLYLGAAEHPAIAAGGSFKAEARTILPLDENGLVQPEILARHLAKHDKAQGLPLVAVQAANHETGIIQPIAELAALVRAAGGLFICDAAQAFGKMPLTITASGADFLIISAHKIGGLKGIGAYIASGGLIRPRALMTGGGQEWGLRGGTTPVELIAAFGAAAAEISENPAHEAGLRALRQMLENGVRKICPQAVIYGENTARLANTTAFSVPQIKAETLQIAFDLAGIAVSNGAACSSGKVGASPVLAAMGAEAAGGAVRVSTGAATKRSDIERFLKAFAEILAH